MNNSDTKTTENKGCKSGFNYCFWAKLIVAIPALPLTAIIAASFFTNPAMQFAAGAGAIALLIYLAIKIDQMPCLLRKVVER
jgi:hypothetical protein